MTMIIPSIPSLPAGYVAQLADMQNLAAAATFALSRPVAYVVDTIGGQAISTTIGSTIPSYDTVLYDADGTWSSSHKGRLTIQTPGWYKIRYGTNCGSGGATCKTGVASTTGSNNPQGSGIQSAWQWGAAAVSFSAGQIAFPGASGLWPFYLYAGDYLQTTVFASGSGNTTGTTVPTGGGSQGGSWFAIEYVSIT